MNGATYECVNIFFKLKYAKTYDAMLSTPRRADGHRRRGDRVDAVSRATLRPGLPRRRRGPGPGPLHVGRARPAGGPADRIRVRRAQRRRRDVHAELAGLRDLRAGPAADVPLLGDVLSALGLSDGTAVGRSLHAAVQLD